jgi:hypothetical protein
MLQISTVNIFYTLFSEPSDIQSGDFFYLPVTDLSPKKIAIFMNFFLYFLFHPPLHHLHCKYGAPKQAKHENYLDLFQNKILFQNIFIFYFVLRPPLKIFQNSSALNKV